MEFISPEDDDLLEVSRSTRLAEGLQKKNKVPKSVKQDILQKAILLHQTNIYPKLQRFFYIWLTNAFKIAKM